MFQVSAQEWEALKAVEAERVEAGLRSQQVIVKTGRGQHRKHRPYAFTEQGVAVLGSGGDAQ